ncbi:hypothetical protein HGRIS_006933 [Hohenbuehelia grisea]|uniref:DUF6534 domain-containing protein n=2 Tax=Hohenbuehelia grisea TaxID=104357 RepID=A0ABR3JB22_9AGAR
MSAPIPVPPNFNIASVTAPLLFGGLFNFMLYGVLVVQVYIYQISFPKDKLFMKALVYGVLVFETIQSALCTADLYYWFSVGFGDMRHLANPYVSPFDTPMMSSLISLTVQAWFCYRIWVLNRKYLWLILVIIPISVVQAVFAIMGAVNGHRIGDFILGAQSRVYNVHVWLIGNAVADILIAGAMSHLLLSARQTDNHYTNSVLTRIVRLTVETNALTAGFALFSLIIFKAAAGTNWFTAPTIVMEKLYSNTLLLTFNNRLLLRNASSSQQSSSTNTTIFALNEQRSPSRFQFSTNKSSTLRDVNPVRFDTMGSTQISIHKTQEIA